MIITLADYWMGRDSRYRGEWTAEVQRHAADLLLRVNAMLTFMHDVEFEAHPETGTVVTSGWRPLQLNARVPGAAHKSLHMMGQAIDLYDPDGDLDEWCWRNQDVLARPDIDLYQEHPGSTKGWLHLQSLPPRSQRHLNPIARKRWFYP